MKKIFLYKLRYRGLNFSNFLNTIIKNNLRINDINRVNPKECTFSMCSCDFKKYLKLKLPYKIEIVKHGGFRYLCRLCLKRIGVFVGIFIIFISSLIIGNRTMYIDVLGSSNETEIKQKLVDYGIELGKSNNINIEEVEKYLLNNVSNLSLVSVKTQGNAIIVNVVEKKVENVNFQPFYAPYNMVIKEVKLISGTLNVSKNSVVKKGGVLVEPYAINSNGERILVEAKADIVADVWFCGSETKYKEIVSYEKTGEKKVYSKISFGKSCKTFNYNSPYENYETETFSNNITSGYFLPIYINKVIYYETEKKVEDFDYENNKTMLLEKSKQKAYDILPNNVIINEIVQNVAELEDKYIFQTYLKTEMEITNEN